MGLRPSAGGLILEAGGLFRMQLGMLSVISRAPDKGEANIITARDGVFRELPSWRARADEPAVPQKLEKGILVSSASSASGSGSNRQDLRDSFLSDYDEARRCHQGFDDCKIHLIEKRRQNRTESGSLSAAGKMGIRVRRSRARQRSRLKRRRRTTLPSLWARYPSLTAAATIT